MRARAAACLSPRLPRPPAAAAAAAPLRSKASQRRAALAAPRRPLPTCSPLFLSPPTSPPLLPRPPHRGTGPSMSTSVMCMLVTLPMGARSPDSPHPRELPRQCACAQLPSERRPQGSHGASLLAGGVGQRPARVARGRGRGQGAAERRG